MEIIKIAAVSVAGVLLALQLKGIKPEYGIYVVIATGTIVVFYAVERLSVVISSIQKLQSYINLNSTYLSVLVKIIGITYAADYAAGICRDAGYQSVAGQIEVFGRLSVLAVSMPVFLALLETINGLMD